MSPLSTNNASRQVPYPLQLSTRELHGKIYCAHPHFIAMVARRLLSGWGGQIQIHIGLAGFYPMNALVFLQKVDELFSRRPQNTGSCVIRPTKAQNILQHFPGASTRPLVPSLPRSHCHCSHPTMSTRHCRHPHPVSLSLRLLSQISFCLLSQSTWYKNT